MSNSLRKAVKTSERKKDWSRLACADRETRFPQFDKILVI